MKVFTRKEIIEKWNYDERYHDYYCCPDCRDILRKTGDVLECFNGACSNTISYNLQGERIK